jgi:hypothetical protein
MATADADALLVVLYELTKDNRETQVTDDQIAPYLDEELKRGIIVVDYVEDTMEALRQARLVNVEESSENLYSITQAGINRITDLLSG